MLCNLLGPLRKQISAKHLLNKLYLIGELAFAMIVIFIAMFFCTFFFYVYEKAFRKLYFMERVIDLVFLFSFLLSKDKARWKSVMDSLPVGIIITDEKKGLAHINQEIRAYFNDLPCQNEAFDLSPTGTQTHSGMNTSTAPIMPSIMEGIKDRVENDLTLKSLIESRDDLNLGEQVHNMNCKKTGKVFEVRTKYLPEIWPKGYKIAVVKDQTIYEQLVREKMLKKYQKMLIASISHEIRNPLNAIAGYTMIIQEEVDNIKIRDHTEKIENAILQIDYILTGACDLLFGMSSTAILQTQEFYLKNAIDSVIKVASASIENKEVLLHTSINHNVPEKICSDQKKYKIILFNLLMNAIKYTPIGSIKIMISFEDESDVLRTTVEDTGIGIDSKRIPLLFELYEKIENVNQYNPQGMGLGLSLSKKLSKELGGNISAISEIGLGSTFSFTIVNNVMNSNGIIFEDSELNCVVEENKEETTINKARIFIPKTLNRIGSFEKTDIKEPSPIIRCDCADVLVVDDDPTNRTVLKVYLNSVNLTCQEAANGKIAVNLVEKRLHNNKCCHRFKLIFMDINMPEMDGTEATEKIRKIFEFHPEATTDIIGVTAANLQTRNDVKNLLYVGFSDICIFLDLLAIFKIGQKPIIKSQFLENIKRFLPKKT